MSLASAPNFKPPPTVECIAQAYCLGIGKKIHNPAKVCSSCLERYDCQQLRSWAYNNTAALALIEEAYYLKQTRKQNIELHNRYLCAFEDPDYDFCQWRHRDLNLRGTRLNCKTVRRKGKACDRCWRRRGRKIGVLQYFTPAKLCYEELEKAVTTLAGSEEETEQTEDEDDDVEGYNIVFD
jgi:hypothetical protein